MFRKIAFWSLIVLFVGGVIAGYFYFIRAQNSARNIYTSVPYDYSYVLECKGLGILSAQANFDKKVSNYLFDLDFLKSALSFTAIVQNHTSSSDILKDFFSQTEIILAGHHTENKIQYSLFTLLPNKKNEAEEIFKLITKNSTSITSKKTKKEYSKLNVNAVDVLFFARENDNLIISSSETAIDQILGKRSNLSSDKNFLKLKDSHARNKSLRCFINPKKTDGSLGKILEANLELNRFSSAIAMNWMSLDLDVKSERIDFNGFLNSDSASYKDLLQEQSGAEIKCYQAMPENTKSFIGYGMSEFKKFRSGIKGKINFQENKMNFSQEEKSELEKVSERIVEEMAFANVLWNDSLNSEYILFKVENIEDCKMAMRKICDTVFTFKEDSTDNPNNDSIFRFKNKSITDFLSSGLFKNGLNYCFFIEDYLVFSGSENSVLLYQNAIKNERILEKNSTFQKVMQANLNESCNFFMYSVLPDSIPNLLEKNSILPKNSFASLQDFNDSKYSLGVQLLNYKDKLILQGSLVFNSKETSKVPELKWKLELDTVLVAGPFIVKNHQTSEEEILVQDAKYQVYLLSAEGKTLWKRRIDERIIGKVHQVDYFKNKKLQILFGTKCEIHLMDRNGKDLEGFPLMLETCLSNPISVFDYENSGDFRICYVSDSLELVMLHSSGKPIDGFKVNKMDAPVSNVVEWKKINGKDLLFVKDNDGRLYIFNRRGEKIFLSDSSFCNPELPLIFTGSNLESLTFYKYNSLNKEIIQATIKGKRSIVKIDVNSDKPFFIFKNINDDELPELIVIEEDVVKVFESSGNFLTELSTKMDLRMLLGESSFGNTNNYSVLDLSGNLYLINEEWKELKPLGIRLDQVPKSLNNSNFVSCLGNEILYYKY